MKIISIQDSQMNQNSYLIKINNYISIIDPGLNFKAIDEYIENNNLIIDKVFLTHGHIDHINSLNQLRNKYGNFKIYIHEEEVQFLFEKKLNLGNFKLNSEDNIIPVNDLDEIDSFKIYHMPGHTKGSIVIEYLNFLFTGDLLFKGTIGRTDLPTGSRTMMLQSLKRLVKSFSRSIKILPGHYQTTTLKDELKNNEFIKSLK